MVKLAPMAMACALAACSTSVRALYVADAAGAVDGHTEAGAPVPPIQACAAVPNAPPGVPPLPGAIQVAYQRTELIGFMHFGLNTFDGTEYGNASMDAPSLFNPTNPDAAAWIKGFADAGFRQVTLIVKHNSGFCLWPSAFTEYSVKNSPWRNGQGDVVREFVDAARAARIRIGLSLSPWDQKYPSSAADYETYFRNQLRELLTKYGPIQEILFDGYNAPTSVNWRGVFQLVKDIQPDTAVWAGREIATTGAEVRYLGNQYGRADRSTSAIADVPNGGPSHVWIPAEAPLSIRSPDWYWHPDNTVTSLKSLQTAYFMTVGMNTTLLLNVPPSTTGLFDTADATLLQSFGDWYGALYKTNVAHGQPVVADSTWAGTGFEASNAVDNDACTYWAAAAGRTTGRLEITVPASVAFKIISIREPIEIGERTTSYHIELKQNGAAWNKAPTDASGVTLKGTVIGQRQLWQLNSTTAEAIALVIDSAKDVPAIAELAVY